MPSDLPKHQWVRLISDPGTVAPWRICEVIEQPNEFCFIYAGIRFYRHEVVELGPVIPHPDEPKGAP